MPGLLNHVTGTLDNIQARKEDTESLLNTIRLPRNMGMITERMPAANYEVQQKFKVIPASATIENKLRATDSLKPQVDVTVTDKVRLSSASVQNS
jgi:hypothetical protein